MAREADGKVLVSGHTLQPVEVMADTLTRLLGHCKEILHVDRWVLVLEHKLLHPPEQHGIGKCEMLAPWDPRQAGAQLAGAAGEQPLEAVPFVLGPGCLEVFPFFTRLTNPDCWSWEFLRLPPNCGGLDC